MKKLVLATVFTIACAGVYAQGAKSDAPAATPATAATPAEPGKEGKALGHQKRGGMKKGHDKDRARGKAEGHDDMHGKDHGDMHGKDRGDMHGADAPAAAAEGKKPSGGKSK